MSTTSRELLDLFDKALSEANREAADGTLDSSGRFYTDEELEAQRVALRAAARDKQAKASAA